jgi:hypothetical protein
MHKAGIAILLFLFFSNQVFAGSVKLISDTWETICFVEVTSGANAPKTPVETFRDVKKDWSITRDSGICYRRSENPKDCNSKMRDWSCSRNPTSGVDNFSLR